MTGTLTAYELVGIQHSKDRARAAQATSAARRQHLAELLVAEVATQLTDLYENCPALQAHQYLAKVTEPVSALSDEPVICMVGIPGHRTISFRATRWGPQNWSLSDWPNESLFRISMSDRGAVHVYAHTMDEALLIADKNTPDE